MRERLFKSSPKLITISGLALECRYKLSLLNPSIILFFWLSWVSTEIKLTILGEFKLGVLRYPETNMHSNWCLRAKTIRQLMKGMVVTLKDCDWRIVNKLSCASICANSSSENCKVAPYFSISVNCEYHSISSQAAPFEVQLHLLFIFFFKLPCSGYPL